MHQLTKEARSFLEKTKAQGKKIVFTNGCFDILHRGHVAYLLEARNLGDVLFVGLNSDASVKRLKGEERPINCETDRKFILENLRAVDFVEIFSEDTPLSLIEGVLPDILVKGGDWRVDQIVGSEVVLSHGGSVQSLSFVEGHSTTSLIQTIREKS